MKAPAGNRRRLFFFCGSCVRPPDQISAAMFGSPADTRSR